MKGLSILIVGNILNTKNFIDENPFIQSLRQALGEIINWDEVADKPIGDISYMEKSLAILILKQYRNVQNNMNNSSNKD